MHAVSELRKIESGAELLARLNTRPNLQSVDPFIFGVSLSSSSRVPTSSVSSCGQLIEINGAEGTGKTELALHCAAKACLPTRSKGVELNGLGSKVIFVDTHHKFSILRFSVILEKQIKHTLQLRRRSQSVSDSCNKQNSSEYKSETVISSSGDQTKHLKQDKRDPMEDCEDFSNSDIEDIINESLDRIFVLKVSNSLQLLASLITLEKSISEDHLYSLLVIDKVSTFFWIDKSSESPGSVSKENTMTCVSRALSRLVNQFGITCLALSAALFSSKKLPSRDTEVGKLKEEEAKSSPGTNDYLGKFWVSVRTKKFLFSKKHGSLIAVGLEQKVEEPNVISAVCCHSNAEKCYVFKDNFMVPL